MKDNMRQAMLLFVKYPVPGKVKTRLAKTIGDQKAARLYQQLAEQNYSVLRECREANLIVVFDPPEVHDKVRQWFPDADQYIPQSGLGLGDRLINAFDWAFERDYKRVVVCGSDTLNLTTAIVKQSLIVLKDADVVVGPAKDGGYYLIGLTSKQSQLFVGINWSTSEVLSQTYQAIKNLRLKCKALSILEDLDEIKLTGAS
ncbi:MAG: TIGR04282 family arsenosugar biosynthesis glycosyltransferase [Candidatus Omnitrophica bacterium]|nr:TIGR04282 family arsenosugar biosynthesis glycosyltransferase [Candidatus Omnitrophota bacterium]